MAADTKQNVIRALAGLPAWLATTVEHSESFRFEALTLLEQSSARLAEIEANPPADPSAAAMAVGAPLHGIVKALLAARGLKSYSTRASLELLTALYAGELPPTQIKALTDLQGMRLQGPAAVSTARVFTDAAARLLTRG